MTNKHSETVEREAFEKALPEYPAYKDSAGEYLAVTTYNAFRGWQASRALSNRTVTKRRTIRATYKGVLENGIFHEHERTFEEVVPPANSEGQFVVTGITPIPMCQTCGGFDWRNRTVGGK